MVLASVLQLRLDIYASLAFIYDMVIMSLDLNLTSFYVMIRVFCVDYGCCKSVDSGTEFCCTWLMWPLIIIYYLWFQPSIWPFVIIHYFYFKPNVQLIAYQCWFRLSAHLVSFIMDLRSDGFLRLVRLRLLILSTLVSHCMHPLDYGGLVVLIFFLCVSSGLIGSQLCYSQLFLRIVELYISNIALIYATGSVNIYIPLYFFTLHTYSRYIYAFTIISLVKR